MNDNPDCDDRDATPVVMQMFAATAGGDTAGLVSLGLFNDLHAQFSHPATLVKLQSPASASQGVYRCKLDLLIARAYDVIPRDRKHAAGQVAIANLIHEHGGRLRSQSEIVIAYRQYGSAILGPRDGTRSSVEWVGRSARAADRE